MGGPKLFCLFKSFGEG
uniref:Uncharacterized protein n=1 Tax=Lepeophtheirus salmonis TaxID=72036 RepID=A0A0K2SW02_LEPSM